MERWFVYIWDDRDPIQYMILSYDTPVPFNNPPKPYRLILDYNNPKLIAIL